MYYISVPQQNANPRELTVSKNIRMLSLDPLILGCPTQEVVGAIAILSTCLPDISCTS